jgi:uncharacterized membrane protein YphA (DoxX/SURF4 family)
MRENSSMLRRMDESGLPLLMARLVLGGVFIYMGANKLGDPIAFMKAIKQYQMLPPGFWLNSTAIVLPWLEVIAGVALILGLYVRGAAALMLVMLSVFTPAILIRTMQVVAETGTPFFQVQFDCGCGGGPDIIWRKLLSNSGLWLLSVVALMSQSRRFSLELWLARRSGNSAWCHLCGYWTSRPTAGLCPRCATPPQIPSPTATC